MADTPKLTIPEITVGQAQKEVTHNEALRAIDALVQLNVIDKDTTTPPAHTHGNVYIVGAGATGDWSGQDDNIAQSYNGSWYFYTPTEGWDCWVADENLIYYYTGSAWESRDIPKNEVSASAPSATDDSSDGFSIGSMWIHTTPDPDEVYRCVDASVGGAVWLHTTLTIDELGTMATQNANAVSITGGSITGITDLAVADGGTAASTALGAQQSLGVEVGVDVQAYASVLDDYTAIPAAKGKIVVYSSTTVNALNVGSDGGVLIAEASATLGVKWGTISDITGFIDWTNATDNFLTTGTMTGGDLTLNGSSIVYSSTLFQVVSDSADASDNSLLQLTGGGDPNVTRGGSINLAGNEHANTGKVQIYAGDVSGGTFEVYTGLAVKGFEVDENQLCSIPTGKLLVGATSVPTGSPEVYFEIPASGGLVISNTATDATNKVCVLAISHYTAAEEALCLIRGETFTSSNIVNIGGGGSGQNSATIINFALGANNTTVTGTDKVRFENAKNNFVEDVKVGGAISDTPSAALEVAGKIEVSQASGGALVNENVGLANPTLLPDKADENTGIGGDGTDDMTFITAGTERVRIEAAGATVIRGGDFILETGGYMVLEGAPDIVTLSAGGNLVPSGTRVAVAANAGTSDTLLTISPGSDGELLLLEADVGDTITVTEGTNLRLSATSHSLGDEGYLLLMYSTIASEWREVSFSDNN